jgi:prepilin-type N-terminal cleavage/methylation domain-containing protein
MLSHRRAFTLIEMTAVILLLGLLTGGVLLSFAAPLDAIRMRQAIEQICAFDSSARQAARRAGREIEMVLDLSDQQLIRRELRDDQRRQTARVSLPVGTRVQEVRGAARSFSSGSVVIRISPLGISRSFALRLAGPQGDRWLMVAGLSGQIVLIDDEERIESILAQASRGHAD